MTDCKTYLKKLEDKQASIRGLIKEAELINSFIEGKEDLSAINEVLSDSQVKKFRNTKADANLDIITLSVIKELEQVLTMRVNIIKEILETLLSEEEK